MAGDVRVYADASGPCPGSRLAGAGFVAETPGGRFEHSTTFLAADSVTAEALAVFNAARWAVDRFAPDYMTLFTDNVFVLVATPTRVIRGGRHTALIRDLRAALDALHPHWNISIANRRGNEFMRRADQLSKKARRAAGRTA